MFRMLRFGWLLEKNRTILREEGSPRTEWYTDLLKERARNQSAPAIHECKHNSLLSSMTSSWHHLPISS